MRSLILLTTAACCALLCSAAAAQTAPRAVPLSETVQGIPLQDEYRWMEDPANKAEWTGWVRAQSQRTRAMLDAAPVRAEFEKLIASTSSSLTRQGGYLRAGGTEIWFRALPGEQTSNLMVRDKAGTRVLVEPAKVTGKPLTAMGTAALSPDGRTVAVHLSDAGSEIGSVRFFDTASGKEAYPALANMWSEDAVRFMPGGLITYLQLAEKPIDGDSAKGVTSYVRRLSGGAQTKVMGGNFAGADLDISEAPVIVAAPTSSYVIGMGIQARADNKIYLAKRTDLMAGTPRWQRLAALEDRIGGIALLGNRAFLLTSKANSARDLAVRTLDHGGNAGPARVLMRGTDTLIIEDVYAVRDGLYVAASTDGVTRLFRLPGGTGSPREIRLPFEGKGYFTPAADGSALIVGLTGWTRNAASYLARGNTITPTGIESSAWSGAKDVVADRYEAISADGTKVPLVVTRLKTSTGRIPTLIEAYGGYGMDTATPFYNRNAMAFIAKGGAMAYCGVRGGGERGRAWHEAGRGPNKPRGQEDLIACAKTLTAKGVAPLQGPVGMGSSMAGVLVPEAALRDPGAFGAMITRVGVVNASRIAFAENGANQFNEVGNPSDPKQFADLVAMDGYQMIAKSKGLPPTLMLIGLNDKRVAPWMTAKFVARAQAKWPGAPIWLRSDDRAGHGMGSTEDVRRDEWADIFAFVWMNQQPR